MAEKEKLTVEERLAKATECYKELKAKFDEKDAELKKATERIKFLENMPEDKVQSNESLLEKIKELEDEIAINGNSGEEIKALNARLDKAKEVFAEQKAKIAELKAVIEEEENNLAIKQTEYDNLHKEYETLHNEYDDCCRHLAEGKAQMEKYLSATAEVKKILAGLE